MLSLSNILNNSSFIKEKKNKQTKDATVINEEKISLNFSNITNIHYDIPGKFINIKKLYLSNNEISDLTGIEVFTKLTNLSLQKNRLIDFIEILKLPLSIENLSIQGNFLEKNPNLYVMLIDRFKKLQEIDGFKITNDTRKTIESALILKSQIIPILSILQELTYNTIKIVNLIKINLELNFSFSENNQYEFYSSKKEKIELLLNKLNLNITSDEFTILKEKYLKSNINPSVFVINKLFSNVFKSKLNFSEFDTNEENSNQHNKSNSKNVVNKSNHNQIQEKESGNVSPILRLYYNNSQVYNIKNCTKNTKSTIDDNTNDLIKNMNKDSLIYKNLSMKIEPELILSNAIAKFYKEDNRNELSKIYLDLFACIMKQYVIKGNYGSLPTFLNYKILKCNNQIEQFLNDALRYDKKYFNYLKTSKLDSNELTIYICKNFDKLLSRYSNCSSETLSKLQFFHFFNLDEQICSVLDQQKFLQNDLRVEKYTNNSINNLKYEEGNEYLHFSNPFSLRLNQKHDIFPDKPKSKLKFECKNLDNEKDQNQIDEYDLSKIHLQIIDSLCDISGQKNISDKIINIMPLECKIDIFLNIFPVMEFPIFPLNFEYMRVLTNVIQDKIYKYVDCFDEILNIYNQLDFLKTKFSNTNKSKMKSERSHQKDLISESKNDINSNMYDNNSKYSNLNQTNQYQFSNQDKVSNTHQANSNSNLNPNPINESFQTFNKKNEYLASKVSANSTISNHNKINLDNNIKQSVSKLLKSFKSYFLYEFKEKIKNKPKTKYLTFSKRLFSKLNDHMSRIKYQTFSDLMLVSNTNLNLESFIKKRINRYKLKALKLIFQNHTRLKVISNQHELSLKSRAYYGLAKYYYTKKFEADKISNARLYYYKFLVKKLFMILKFNLSQNHQGHFNGNKDKKRHIEEEDFVNEIDYNDNNVFIKNSLVPNTLNTQNTSYQSKYKKENDFSANIKKTNLNPNNYESNKDRTTKSKPKTNLPKANSNIKNNKDNKDIEYSKENKTDLNNELNTLLKQINNNIKNNSKKPSEQYKKTQYNQIKNPNSIINQSNLSIIKQTQIASPLFSTKSLEDANLDNENIPNNSTSINLCRKNMNTSSLNNSKHIIVGNPNFLNRTKNTLFKELI